METIGISEMVFYWALLFVFQQDVMTLYKYVDVTKPHK